jgi:hypothetical protein
MRNVRFLSGCICLVLAWNQVHTADAQVQTPASPSHLPVMYMNDAPRGPQAPATPQAPARPPEAKAPEAPPAAQPPAVPLTEPAPAGTEAPGGAYAPQMLGDSLVFFTQGIFGLNQQQINSLFGSGISPLVSISSNSGTLEPFTVARALAGSGFKIADNESPRPQDRYFLNVNYFTAVWHGLRPDGFAPQVRLAREIFGMEKTFLDGDASVGMRVPFFQVHDQKGLSDISDIGNLTLFSKFVLLRNPDTGSLISAGAALTLPTGPETLIATVTSTIGGTAIATVTDRVNPTYIQPFVGWIYNVDQDIYLQGFHSVAFSTDDSAPDIWFNDIGIGAYLYRGSSCSIVPIAELHLTTPFEQDSALAFPIGVPDTLIATLGTHFISNRGPVFTFGWGFPLTGPQPFANELIFQMNWPF